MKTEFLRAVVPKEIRNLVIFDHKAFRDYPSDWFDRDDWEAYDPWWMIINNKKIGCCAFEPNVDFQEDIREYGKNPRLRGSLYIVTTGILPSFQSVGFGGLLRRWQLLYPDSRRGEWHRRLLRRRGAGDCRLPILSRRVSRSTPSAPCSSPTRTTTGSAKSRRIASSQLWWAALFRASPETG